MAATLGVLGLSALFGISPLEWAAIVAAIGLVWVAEALNTAVEHLADAVTKDLHPRIRDAKDLAAGAVLAAAATAFVVGLIVFVPYLLTLFVTLGGA